jgi:hypothetical protein
MPSENGPPQMAEGILFGDLLGVGVPRVRSPTATALHGPARKWRLWRPWFEKPPSPSCFRQRSSLGLEERDLKNKNLGRNKKRTAAFGWNYCNLGIWYRFPCGVRLLHLETNGKITELVTGLNSKGINIQNKGTLQNNWTWPIRE